MRGREWLLLLLAAGLSASTIWREVGPHDEGLMLQAAHRIASGELPYRDFWWNYGPGQPLLLAPFDRSLVGWRVVRVVLDAVVALLAYRLARRETGGREPLALLAWVAVAGAMAFPTGPGPNPAALALGLGGILLAPRRPGLAGALCGLAAVFRIEVGAAAALGALLHNEIVISPAIGGKSRSRFLGAAIGVGIAGWLPFFLAAPGDLLDQTVGFLGIQGMQRVPFPLDPEGIGLDPNKLLELYLPLILLAGTAAWLTKRSAIALAPLAAAGVLYLLGRTDEFHLVPLAVVLPIMLAAAAAHEKRRASRAVFISLIALIALHGLERKAGQLLHPPELARVPNGGGVRADEREVNDLAAVLEATRGRTIFVAPPRFDRVTVGNPLLYVLAEKDNSTRHDVIQPGVVTEEETQREMIDDLEKRKPDVLIRWHDPRTRPEDNASGRERGAKLLDRWLSENYANPRRIGVYALLTSRAARTAGR